MKYEFDAAISYDHGIQKKAKDIHSFLEADKWKVFYAPENQAEILSEKARQELYDIYKNRSFVKVLLITEDYLQNEWTLLEMRVSLESTKKNRKRLIAVSYVDGKKLPDEIKDIFYIDGTKDSEVETAIKISRRLEMLKNDQKEKESKKSKNHGKKKQDEKAHTDSSPGGLIINNQGIVAGSHAHIEHIKF